MAFDLGGRENLTEAQQQLIRRCAMLSAQCELMEAEAVQGKPLNATKGRPGWLLLKEPPVRQDGP